MRLMEVAADPDVGIGGPGLPGGFASRIGQGFLVGTGNRGERSVPEPGARGENQGAGAEAGRFQEMASFHGSLMAGSDRVRQTGKGEVAGADRGKEVASLAHRSPHRLQDRKSVV